VQRRQSRTPRSHGLLQRLGSAWYNECRGASDSQAGQAGLTDGLHHTAKPWEVSELGWLWVCQGIEGLWKIKIRLELSGTQSLADGHRRRWALGAAHCAVLHWGRHGRGRRRGPSSLGRCWMPSGHRMGTASWLTYAAPTVRTWALDRRRPVNNHLLTASRGRYKACRGCLWALFRYQTPLHVSAAIKKHHPSAEKGPKRHSWTILGPKVPSLHRPPRVHEGR